MVPDGTTIRRIEPGDAAALAAFYNGLSEASHRTFQPLAIPTTLERCSRICAANHVEPPTECDFVALRDGEVIGWSFIWHLDAKDPDDGPVFGLGVADAFHGQGLGSRLTRFVLAWADVQGIPYTSLIVVKDNLVAQHIYEKAGFLRYGEFLDEERDLAYYRMIRRHGLPVTKAGSGTTVSDA